MFIYLLYRKKYLCALRHFFFKVFLLKQTIIRYFQFWAVPISENTHLYSQKTKNIIVNSKVNLGMLKIVYLFWHSECVICFFILNTCNQTLRVYIYLSKKNWKTNECIPRHFSPKAFHLKRHNLFLKWFFRFHFLKNFFHISMSCLVYLVLFPQPYIYFSNW